MLKYTILKTGLILPFFRYISSSALIEVFLLLLFKIPLKRCCTGFKSSDILGQAIVFTVCLFFFLSSFSSLETLILAEGFESSFTGILVRSQASGEQEHPHEVAF